MKVVVAIDSFKGSLSSLEAGNAVKEAIHRVNLRTEVLVKPLADGGEGTVAALAADLHSEMIAVEVHGPLLEPVLAQYCILKDTNTAVIEMAAASGITLIAPEARDPLETTTYGVGELIKDAIGRGCRRFIVALGAKGLASLHMIGMAHVLPELQECTFSIACDVTNPLCGAKGCSAVFGPQKGATAEMVADMDRWLEQYAGLAGTVSTKADRDYPGAGAAGGLGFAFLAFTNARLRSGIEIVLDEIGLEDDIKDADIVVTGEGRLDAQTILGKAPIGVARLAKKYSKRVIAFSGCVTRDAEICNEHGINAFFPVLRSVTTLEDALDTENAYQNLTDTAYQVFRLLL